MALKAIIQVRNNGSLPLDSYNFSLTIPADDHAQQRLLRIDPPRGDSYTMNSHENGVDRFMGFTWTVPAYAEIVKEVVFLLHVQPYDYRTSALPSAAVPDSRFIAPSQYVESEASEVVAIARGIERTYTSPEERLLAAYRYPMENLRYREMSTNEGARYGLLQGSGDCTEYAAIFIALARAMGIPARMTSDFHFTTQKSFSVPNHHSAEVYLGGSWVPVDPNLALDPSLGYGFGVGSTRKAILKRGDSWVWSYAIPNVSSSYRKSQVETSIRWEIRAARWEMRATD